MSTAMLGQLKDSSPPKMYKRPIIRTRALEVQNDAVRPRTKWNPTVPPKPPGRQWTPPVDFEFIAKHMSDPEPYLKRCNEWFEAHSQTATRVHKEQVIINPEPVLAIFEKYSREEDGPTVPPVVELEAAWRAAGYSEERIAKAVAHREKIDSTGPERQLVIDAIFAKFPSAYKPGPKLKPKKVIKVVKKKMPQTSNE